MYMLDEMGGPSNFAIVLEYEIQRIFGGFSILHLFSDLVTVVLRVFCSLNRPYSVNRVWIKSKT